MTPRPAGLVPVGAASSRTPDLAAARRRELTARRQALGGGHRTELRAALELARVSCAAQLAADLDALVRRRADDPRRTPCVGRAEVARPHSRRLSEEVDVVRARSVERFAATAGPAVARVAARHCPGAAPMPWPGSDPAGTSRPAEPAGTTGPQVSGGSSSELSVAVADPRLWAGLVGLVGLPVLGAGGIGWSAALSATGMLVLLVVLIRTRVVAASRARCRDELARAVVAATRAGERELHRQVVEVEAAAGAALDRAVAKRRALADAELRALGV